MHWVILFCILWHVSYAAKITTKAQTFKVMERGSLEMPCQVQDMDEDVSVAWYKGDNLLFLDEERLTDDQRYSVTKEGLNYILSVSQAEPMDSSEFICSITDPVQKITHKVTVISVPYIVLAPEMPVYHVKVGETNIVVKCFGKGNPAPSISWERKDDETPEGVIVRGSSLVIPRADHSHSGTYACSAVNEAGSDSRSIEIRVSDPNITEEKPWVKAAYGDGFIPAKKGNDTEIVCTYNGSPDPQLEWFFNGYKLNFQEERFKGARQTFQREKGFTKATLLLSNINEDNFGDYVCRASNQLGSEQVAVHVSGRPGPPKLELNENLLSWTVRSHAEILEYRVFLRLQKQDEWARHVDIRVSKNDRKDLDIYTREIDIREYVEPQVKYEIQVKARNGLGWGSFARDYITVEVPKDDNPSSSTSTQFFIPTFCGFLLSFLF